MYNVFIETIEIEEDITLEIERKNISLIKKYFTFNNMTFIDKNKYGYDKFEIGSESLVPIN